MNSFCQTHRLAFLGKMICCLLFILSVGCSQKTDTSKIQTTENKVYTISVLSKYHKVQEMFLCDVVKGKLRVIDTAKVSDGSCIFTGSVDSPKRVALYFDYNSSHNPFVLLLANEKIRIEVNEEDFLNSVIKNSHINSIYSKYQTESSKILQKITPLYYRLQQARLQNNVEELQEVNRKIITIGNNFLEYSFKFIEEQSNSQASVFVLEDLLRTSQIDSLTFFKKYKRLKKEKNP